MAKQCSPPAAICFFLTFLLGLGLVLLIAYAYSYLDELPDYIQWQSIYRLSFYGAVLLLMLLLIRALASSPGCSRALSWPFSPILRVVPKDRTSWDWLQLIGGTTILSIVASVISFFVTQSSKETAVTLQNQKERQTLLTEYINDMTQLIKETDYAAMRNELKVAISSRTLNTLEALEDDGLRQGYTLRFARRAFPDFTCPVPVNNRDCRLPANISLKNLVLKGLVIDDTASQFSRDYFENADLTDADLEGSILTEVNFYGASLVSANLRNTYFGRNSTLNDAKLKNATLHGTEFHGTSLEEVKDLQSARFSNQEPTVFWIDTMFNKAFGSRICQFLRSGKIVFSEGDLGKEDVPRRIQELKSKHDLTCDPIPGH